MTVLVNLLLENNYNVFGGDWHLGFPSPTPAANDTAGFGIFFTDRRITDRMSVWRDSEASVVTLLPLTASLGLNSEYMQITECPANYWKAAKWKQEKGSHPLINLLRNAVRLLSTDRSLFNPLCFGNILLTERKLSLIYALKLSSAF